MESKHCGNELPNEANVCPNCEAPVNSKRTETETAEARSAHMTGLSAVAFTFSLIAFALGIFALIIELGIIYIAAMGILPAMAGLGISAYVLSTGSKNSPGKAKAYAIVSIVLSALLIAILPIAFS